MPCKKSPCRIDITKITKVIAIPFTRTLSSKHIKTTLRHLTQPDNDDNDDDKIKSAHKSVHHEAAIFFFYQKKHKKRLTISVETFRQQNMLATTKRTSGCVHQNKPFNAHTVLMSFHAGWPIIDFHIITNATSLTGNFGLNTSPHSLRQIDNLSGQIKRKR